MPARRSRRARVVEIVIVGSPIGKANALDDASQDMILVIQDEAECLATLLDRYIAWFNNPAAYAHPGMNPMDPNEVAMVKPVIFELAKVLLYLNLPDAEKRKITERSDLEKRLRVDSADTGECVGVDRGGLGWGEDEAVCREMTCPFRFFGAVGRHRSDCGALLFVSSNRSVNEGTALCCSATTNPVPHWSDSAS